MSRHSPAEARRLSLALLALLALLSGSAAVARDRTPRAPLFHLATPELQARLKPRVAQNVDAVAQYQRHGGRTGGTAFLVTPPDAAGLALVLTNHHVALFDKATVEGDALLFHRGGSARPTPAPIVDCVAANREIDYALLRVQLPAPLRDLSPVRLSRQGDEGLRSVYNAGFPRIWEAERARATRGEPSLVARGLGSRPVFERALGEPELPPKTFQVGTVDRGMWVEPFITLRLANETGSSGSPVFARGSDCAVAMLGAGGGNVHAFVLPIGRVLDHLARTRGRVEDPALRGVVNALLASAPPYLATENP